MAGYLRPEEYQFVKKNILVGQLDELVATRIIPSDPGVSKGAQEAKRWKYNYPDEGAELIPKGGPYPKITTSMEAVTVPIHKFGIGTEFDEWDLESSRSMGQYALDKQIIQDMGRKMAENVDDYIFKGNTDVGVTGLYGLAGNTYACTAKWDSATPDPYDDLNTATGLLEADGFDCKYLIMNKVDYHLLRRDDAYGNVYLKKVTDTLDISKESILKSSALTKGTAMLCDAGSDISELKVAESLTVLPAEKIPDTDRISIRCREKLGMDVYETNAYCTITNIS